jgi:hypothetical protein
MWPVLKTKVKRRGTPAFHMLRRSLTLLLPRSTLVNRRPEVHGSVTLTVLYRQLDRVL